MPPIEAPSSSPLPPSPAPLTSLAASPDAGFLPGPPLSPHSVSLLLLLRFFLTERADPTPLTLDPPPSSSSSPTPLHRFGLLLYNQLKGSPHPTEPSLLQLQHSLLSSLSPPSPTLSPSPSTSPHPFAQHCVRVWRSQLAALDSPDAVDELFAALPSLLLRFASVQGKMDVGGGGWVWGVDGTSVMGLFVRQQVWAYQSGMFAQLATLWEALERYKQEGDRAENEEDEGMKGDMETSAEEGAGERTRQLPSVSQLHALIRRKGEEVQSLLGRVSHEEMDLLCVEVEQATALSSIPLSAAAASTSASVSFLRYLVAVAHFDYEGAINHLHRFTDYTSAASQPPPTSSSSSTVATLPSSSVESGLLNLALLHGRFGHVEMAVELIQEAVSIAQQQQDQTSLQQAMQLLTTLTSATPAPTSSLSSSLFDRSVGALSVSADAALKLIDEWKASGGAGPPPSLLGLSSTLAHTLLSTAQSQLTRPLSSSSPTSPASLWSTLSSASSLSSLYDLQHCVAVERLLRAQAWATFGSRHLASLSSELHWRMSSPSAPAVDSLSSLYTLAGDGQRSADEALALLRFAHSQYPHLSHLSLSSLSHFLRFRWAVRRGDLSHARAFASAISQLSGSVNGVLGASQLMEARLVWAQLRCMEGAWSEAFEEAERLVQEAEERREVALTVRLLLFQAHCRVQSTDPFPPSPSSDTTAALAPSTTSPFTATSALLATLPLLLRASSLAAKAGAATLTAAVHCALSRVHLALGNPREGLRRIRQSLLHLIEHAPHEQLIDALHALALCLLHVDDDDDERAALVEAAQVLELELHAVDALQWSGHSAHAAYLLARVYHELEEAGKRDDMAHRFLLYQQRAGT